FALPPIAKCQGAALLEVTEIERNEELTFEQDHRIAQRDIVQPRARTEPGCAPSHQARHIVFLLHRQSDNLFSFLLGAYTAGAYEDDSRGFANERSHGASPTCDYETRGAEIGRQPLDRKDETLAVAHGSRSPVEIERHVAHERTHDS